MNSSADDALLSLLDALKARDYRFVTPTPASHARVIARPDRREARTLRDIFGWSLPFAAEIAGPDMLALMHAAGIVEADPTTGLLRSALRVSTLDGRLFLHSAFPTEAEDAVFFGPDSYRFADLIGHTLAALAPPPNPRIVDIGTGAGVGAIVAASLRPDAALIATDINPAALRLAAINARAAGIGIETRLGAGLAGAGGDLDVVLANPPYIVDAAARHYRHGGDMHGAGVALDMVGEALSRLARGGRLILYTGSAIVDGADPLRARLKALAAEAGCTASYRELDPDVFGEELDAPAYCDVDRIALVAAIVTRS
jgi:methylase of polypeptide subunit release factors